MIREHARQALIDRTGAAVSQRHVTAGSIETAYLVSGSGEPIILLHGGGAGAVTWYPSIGPLSKHFQVIAPDIVGYGESDKPDACYDRAYFSQWLKDFLVALKIPKAHIVGLSQGGAIALQFVLDNPQMVDKLVLVNAGALGAKPSLASMLGMLWLNSFPSALASRFYSRYILFNPANRDPNHSHYSLSILNSSGGKNAFRQGKGAAVSKIPDESLGQIKNESLVVWGEDDKLFAIEHGKAAATIMPNARYAGIQNAGHLPLMDQPDIFNNILLGFLLANQSQQRAVID